MNPIQKTGFSFTNPKENYHYIFEVMKFAFCEGKILALAHFLYSFNCTFNLPSWLYLMIINNFISVKKIESKVTLL